MDKDAIIQLQIHLAGLGLYPENAIDGSLGPLTLAAVKKLGVIEHNSCLASLPQSIAPTAEALPWGSKVSAEFKSRVRWIVQALQWPTEAAGWLMGCMAFETGGAFRADTKNLAGSSGTGLIQFMSYTAVSLGTTVEALAKMTPENQLNYVYKYFVDYRGKIKNIGDLYMTILLPRGIGKNDSYILWNEKTAALAYKQNKGLDYNKDGNVTRGEAVTKVTAMYNKGLGVGYVG